MPPKKKTLDEVTHHYFGVHFNQLIWDYFKKTDRTEEETQEMIDLAHASNHHWRKAGTVVNQARGAYMMSKAYLHAGEPENALKYAKRCHELTFTNETEMKDFDLAYAEEVMWRAESVMKNTENANHHKAEATRLAELVEGEEDKKYVLLDLAADI